MTDALDPPNAPVSRRRHGWRMRLFVLGGFGVAALYTVGALALDAGRDAIGPLLLAALAWTILASLAGALWFGFRHGDWSAFRKHELPDGRDDRMDWIGRTGRYSYLRHQEEDRLRDDDHLR